MARPIDAIKHQAKTVTVGTSRIVEKIGGVLFDKLIEMDITHSQLTNQNIIILKKLQNIVKKIIGATLYRIKGLNLLGEPDEDSIIEIVNKQKNATNFTDRNHKSSRLKGTNKIIVRQGIVYIGKGRKDERIVILVPILAHSNTKASKIEFLLELHVSLKQNVPLTTKIQALSGKYEHIRNILQENSIAWKDDLLELIKIDELFGYSAEKVSEIILYLLNNPKAKIKNSQFNGSGFNNDYRYIRRSIKFPPEYYQAGIQILNYFGTVLKKKYPSQEATVRIEQEGMKVTMIIDPIEGDKEIIEQALDDYGLVITGQLPPDEFTDNRQLLTELKYELKLAEARIEAQRDLLQYQRTDIAELKHLIHTALSNPSPIQIEATAIKKLGHDYNLYFDFHSQVSNIQEALKKIQPLLASDSDEAMTIQELQESLEKIKHNDSKEEISKSTSMSKVRKLLIEMGDENSNIGKTVKGFKKGAEIVQSIASVYNSIAQWCGLPLVPKAFLKKSE